jgi:hypothetical protein
MSEEKKEEPKDSFQMPVKKSPIFIYALLQIPLVIIMVIILYVMYQSRP